MRQIADEHIMIVDTGQSLDYTRAISLNDTAIYLVKSVEGRDFSIEDWADLLQTRYEVDRAVALDDARTLAETLREVGIIEG